MTIPLLIIGLLAAPAAYCMIIGFVRFPLKSQDKAIIAQKRWKHIRLASRLLVISWVVYGFTIWSYIPSYLSPQTIRAEAVVLNSITLYYFVQFLSANMLGLLTFLPLALAYVAYLFAFSWCDRRIRQEEFPLTGAVHLLLFEAIRTLLPYALLFLFVVSGVMPWIIAKRTIVQFNALIAFFILASCSLVYFKSLDIAKALVKGLVPFPDAALEQRVAELAAAAGVKAGKLFRLRTFGYPYAQGYALLNHDICLSDHVVDVFAPAERDAVIAHELGHLKHIKALVIKRFAVYAVLVSTFLFLLPLVDVYFSDSLPGFLVKLALIYGCLLLMIRQNKSSRGYELEADKFSASVVGDEVFVKAMERLHEVNFLPRRFDEKGRENMSHPSLEIRTNAILQSKNASLDQRNQIDADIRSAVETGFAGRFSMKNKIAIAGAVLLIFVFGFLTGAVWMSVKFAGSMGAGSLGPDREEQTTFNSGDALWAYQFFGGMFKNEEQMKPVPKGKGVLQVRITRDDAPAAGVECKLFLNGKFKTGEQATDANGVLTLNLPEGEWYINSVQCNRWANKPEGDFMFVSPGQRSLGRNEGEFFPGLNDMGKKVMVNAKTPDGPQLSLQLNQRVVLFWPKKSGQKQEASIAKSKINWQPYPKATDYMVRVHHVTREGNRTTYMPVIHKRVTGGTSFPLSQFAHARDAAAKEEYAVTVEAYGANGEFLSESQSFDGTFTLTDGNALMEDGHGVYGSADQGVIDSVYREKKILDSAETMIKEKMYDQAEAMLTKVAVNDLLGKKYVMKGYLFASEGDCKKAKAFFEEARKKGEDCIPEEYQGKCK